MSARKPNGTTAAEKPVGTKPKGAVVIGTDQAIFDPGIEYVSYCDGCGVKFGHLSYALAPRDWVSLELKALTHGQAGFDPKFSHDIAIQFGVRFLCGKCRRSKKLVQKTVSDLVSSTMQALPREPKP